MDVSAVTSNRACIYTVVKYSLAAVTMVAVAALAWNRAPESMKDSMRFWFLDAVGKHGLLPSAVKNKDDARVERLIESLGDDLDLLEFDKPDVLLPIVKAVNTIGPFIGYGRLTSPYVGLLIHRNMYVGSEKETMNRVFREICKKPFFDQILNHRSETGFAIADWVSDDRTMSLVADGITSFDQLMTLKWVEKKGLQTFNDVLRKVSEFSTLADYKVAERLAMFTENYRGNEKLTFEVADMYARLMLRVKPQHEYYCSLLEQACSNKVLAKALAAIQSRFSWGLEDDGLEGMHAFLNGYPKYLAKFIEVIDDGRFCSYREFEGGKTYLHIACLEENASNKDWKAVKEALLAKDFADRLKGIYDDNGNKPNVEATC